MFKLNLPADWTRGNLEPATMEEIALVAAAAFAAAGLIALVVIAIFSLLVY